jgi:uncharacterized membrane protein SpoIIM required for sporulation
MRETKFIEQNREKWSEFEDMLRDNHRDPEKLNDLYIQIMDDLSYARTFYPNRSVRMYLNGMAQRIFHNVYRGKRFPAGRFRQFWTDELPRLMWESRQALLLSFSIFSLACVIGVVSSRINPDFARVILGDGYVEMTLRNIENNDPMAVYKESKPLGMSVGIAANNLFVALRTAIFGVLASIGTVFILMYNGIMLGAFQYFFVEKGLFWQSFLTIWIHGTLEISAIIIAGAAGLVAGSGLLFPGTYTRYQAFQLSMRRGLKIFIGLIPMFMLAAFFEGFLTRYTDTPAAVRFMFILTSLAFVLGYFVILPWYKSRVGFGPTALEKELPFLREQAIEFTTIKSAGESFSDVFTLLRRQPRITGLGLMAASGVFLGLASFYSGSPLTETFGVADFPSATFQGWWEAMDWQQSPVLFGGQILLFWGIAQLTLFALHREMSPEQRQIWRARFFGLHQLVALFVPFLVLWFLNSVEAGLFVWLIGMLFFPFLGLWVAVAHYESSFWLSIPRAWALMWWSQGYLFGFLVINMGLLLFLFLDSSIWRDIVLPFFSWLVPAEAGKVAWYMAATTAFASSFVALFVWLMLIAGGAMHYFSSREIADAAHLREGIAQVGAVRQIRGLARE